MQEAPEGMIPIKDFANQKEIDESKVIQMIREGFYSGRKVGQQWFVNANELKDGESVQTDENNQNVLGLSTLSKLIIGSFSLFFTLLFLYRAVDPKNLQLGSAYFDYAGVIFCLVVSASCFLPKSIAGYFGDLIAISVICLAIWFLIVALPNPEPGQNPIGFASLFGGLSLVHLVKRYKYVFAAKSS